MKKTKTILLTVIILAFFLRFFGIEHYPAGFTADEAAQGYTAYSILKTGRDEWGVPLPISPRSFGDFKPPLYTYLVIPSVAIFGLNEFAVRFPAVIFGTLAVLATYLLVQELFFSFRFSILAAFFLAISPWHISLSRGAFEANLTTFLLTVFFWFFLKGLKDSKFFVPSALMFGLNLFSYHSARLVSPLFLVFLIWWGRKKLFSKKIHHIFLPSLIFIFFLVLMVSSLFKGGGTRASDVGIFSAKLEAPKLFIDNYLSYFSLEFLFTKGAKEASYGMIPERGVLYLFELPFLILTFISLAKRWNKNFLPILVWLILAPIPAALSRGVGYHANRVAIMMPAIQIISAYGFFLFLSLIPKYKKMIIFLVGLIIAISFLWFLWFYFRYFPKISACAMSYGWRETIDHLNRIDDKYEKVIVSRKFSEPQAFIAFYKKWDPLDFQKESQDWLKYQKEGLKFVDQLDKYNLGKYEFRNIDWKKDKNLEGVLFIGKEGDFPSNEFLTKRIIPYPDGQPAFLIVERP